MVEWFGFPVKYLSDENVIKLEISDRFFFLICMRTSCYVPVHNQAKRFCQFLEYPKNKNHQNLLPRGSSWIHLPAADIYHSAIKSVSSLNI